MQKMKEESNKARMTEMKRQKELAQLQKEARRRENELRELRIREQRREAVLKRKQEEMQNLRRAQRPSSTRNVQQNGSLAGGNFSDRSYMASSRGVVSSNRRRSMLNRMAKLHWINLEKNVSLQLAKYIRF